MAGFHRLFIANRGEVAVRIARTCDELGITPVFAASEADLRAPYLAGREVVCVGPSRSSESYLRPERLVQAARQTACTALHPGWGFLSENAVFATLCEQHGITFIGPPAGAMQLMGKKTPAKRVAAAAGLRLIDGSEGILRDAAEARTLADRLGYPVLLKAESGGGGRGMRIARSSEQVETAFSEAEAEARAAFGDGRLYLECLIEGARHVEIQLLVDRYGHGIHLAERDCTVQRHHQKLIEESPSPVLDPAERDRSFEAALRAARSIGYVGAGTMEFLLLADGSLRFMEMNTRLQVEHSVSEMRTGIDLVAQQIRIAAGEPLAIEQSDVVFEGHAVECRINAEDPAAAFKPSPGLIRRWESPGSDDPDIRVDTHVQSGYEVPPFYDSLLCKVITRGAHREAACDKMIEALEALVCEGVATTTPMHLTILRSPEFRASAYDTRSIPGWPA